jgi:hypothetical protein
MDSRAVHLALRRTIPYPIATFIAYFAPRAGIIATGALGALYMFPRNVAAIVPEETSSGNR